MRNKLFLGAALSVIISASAAMAQEASSDFYQNILFSDEYEQKQQENQAKDSAAALLKKDVTSAPLPTAETEIAAPQTLSQALDNLKNTYGSAPLGLVWGISMSDVEKSGVRLIPQPMKDYTNSFLAEKLPNPLKDFSTAYLIFGDSDKLYRVLARSDKISDDTPNAAKTLKLYQYYYNLLSKKYGNAQQNYSLANTNVDENPTQANSAAAQSPEDNPNLLANLISGAAVLYATFGDEDVGVALAVNVDGDNQTYIEIDYRNLKIIKENELNVLEAL